MRGRGLAHLASKRFDVDVVVVVTEVDTLDFDGVEVAKALRGRADRRSREHYTRPSHETLRQHPARPPYPTPSVVSAIRAPIGSKASATPGIATGRSSCTA